jgi:hypothetical protein
MIVEISVTVIGALIVAGLLAARRKGWGWFRAKRSSANEPIRIEPPHELSPSRGIRYALLYVRDGTDAIAGDEPPVNKTIEFTSVSPTTLEAKLVYRRALGCQFKCFFDVRDETFSVEDINRLTADRPWRLDGPKPVENDDARCTRYFFLLLDKYRLEETRDHFVNNYVEFTPQ